MSGPGDTLSGIARRFGTTVGALLEANVICHPGMIFAGQVLIIPRPGLELPRAGAGPYYVVQPGDTLWCLARLFGTTVERLARNNQIADPRRLRAGTELLVVTERPDPTRLAQAWARTGGVACSEIPEFTVHGLYYQGSFLWEALGRQGIPHLLRLLEHPCDTVRAYAAISLGRLGRDGQARPALEAAARDPSPTVRTLAALALRRIALAEQVWSRIHLTTAPNRLLQEPNLESPGTDLPAGTAVVALRWFIPSPTGEEGPRGGIQIYDQVRVPATGQVGFLPRGGLNELTLI